MKNSYVNRRIEPSIKQALHDFPIVVLTGPRQTGKSTMLKKLLSDFKYITLDDPQKREFALKDPMMFLENAGTPLILDEIQYTPQLLPYLKMVVDRDRSKNGQYVLTGSQIFPLMQGITESLAGRVALFELLGLSFQEINPSKNIFENIFKGFYPEPAVHKVDPQTYYSSYIQTYLERDIRQIKNVHDLSQFQSFLQLIAARTANLINLNEIARECGISTSNAKNWLSLLESTRIIFLLRPYFSNITKRVIKTPKIFFTDTGLSAYLLKYPNPEILMSGPMNGAFFENMIISEFLKKKLNNNLNIELYFYRDSNQNEIDLVLDSGQTKKLIEIKMKKTFNDSFIKNIRKIQKLIPNSEGYLLSPNQENIKLEDNIQTKNYFDAINDISI